MLDMEKGKDVHSEAKRSFSSSKGHFTEVKTLNEQRRIATLRKEQRIATC
jgi:hypothetical protein